MYDYSATLIEVIDGDTVDMLIDLGCSVFRKERMRLYGINCSELNARDPVERARAQAAKQYLIACLPTGPNEIYIKTLKDKNDKYGRLLVKIFVDELCLNDDLVVKGHAVRYMV